MLRKMGLSGLFLVLALAVPSVVPTSAFDKNKDKDEASDYAHRVNKSAEVLRELMRTPDKGIPEELMERAHAVAVIPHVVKAAFGIGGRYGKGLVAGRTAGRWGVPAFVDIGGGSFGLQIGGEAADLVMVFTTADSLKSLLDSKLKLGADASVAAGPVGRKVEMGTDAKFNSAIYSYSRSKGLLAGISLDGAVLTINDSANEKVYGPNVTGTDILVKGTVKQSPVTLPFVQALREFSPKISQAR